jgi:homoserine kinase
LIKGFFKNQVLKSALAAGALGTALSGAGPSVMAFTRAGQETVVGQAMAEAFGEAGVKVQVLYLKPDMQGVHYY